MVTCSSSITDFVTNTLNLPLSSWQDEMLRCESDRILVNSSRCAGKTQIAAVMAIHAAMTHPNHIILLLSPTVGTTSIIRERVLNINDKLPISQIVTKNHSSIECLNGSSILFDPIYRIGSDANEKYDLIIEDEAAFIDDTRYYEALERISASGRVILMSTPNTKRGHFYSEWSGSSSWYRITVPGENNPLLSQSFIDRERKYGSGEWFKREFCCEFI